jgi:predicted Abi (CAAX) family protease
MTRKYCLVVDEVSPKASHGAVVGVGWQEGRAVERLVDVLDDDERFADGAVAMEENGNLLVDGVLGEEQVALVVEVLVDELISYSLEP